MDSFLLSKIFISSLFLLVGIGVVPIFLELFDIISAEHRDSFFMYYLPLSVLWFIGGFVGLIWFA